MSHGLGNFYIVNLRQVAGWWAIFRVSALIICY